MEDYAGLILPLGKLPTEALKRVVLKYLGAESKDVLLGPAPGEDGAVIRVGNKIVISSMDPITGAVENIGWLAVNINANDVATFGVKPSFFSSCILLPENSSEDTVEAICKQMDSAAERLGIAIIGGHTEVSPGLHRPIVIGCMMGVSELGRYVTSSSARPGNKIILTKSAGIEGTAILAKERYDTLQVSIDKSLLESAKQFYERISIVEEALAAFNTGGVTAMHDPTEGGVAGGIHELADASNLGFKIIENSIPVSRETLEICKFFGIDPLHLISSGALLITADNLYVEAIMRNLAERGINAAVIGEMLEDPEKRLIIRSDGSVGDLERPTFDHLWLALENR
ncbi:MAG: AIR synthase family protein [Nitrososphaerota archaeon]|nr:AIR synthase family protein [Candidatus Bathyarchaeota archaeon]MDW8049122.1 AIR synthase family protein [Nitrososphaerota archaeon]